MHKNATKCNETLSKWCKNKHGASKFMDTLETYQAACTRCRLSPAATGVDCRWWRAPGEAARRGRKGRLSSWRGSAVSTGEAEEEAEGLHSSRPGGGRRTRARAGRALGRGLTMLGPEQEAGGGGGRGSGTRARSGKQLPTDVYSHGTSPAPAGEVEQDACSATSRQQAHRRSGRGRRGKGKVDHDHLCASKSSSCREHPQHVGIFFFRSQVYSIVHAIFTI
jgi:hypothetical protein